MAKRHHFVISVPAGEPAVLRPLDDSEIPPAIAIEDGPSSLSPYDEVVGSPDNEAVGVRAELAQTLFHIRANGKALQHLFHRMGPDFLPLALGLTQAVQEKRNREAERERDGDAKDLAVERVDHLWSGCRSAGRQRDPLNGLLGKEVGRHAEECAEHRTLQGDLGELERREISKMPDLHCT